jgi:hypothetical protein
MSDGALGSPSYPQLPNASPGGSLGRIGAFWRDCRTAGTSLDLPTGYQSAALASVDNFLSSDPGDFLG